MPHDPAADASPVRDSSARAGSENFSSETQSPDEPISESEPSPDERSTFRFRVALGIYLLLAALAWFTLDGVVRDATLVFLGGLTFKSWLAVLKDRQG